MGRGNNRAGEPGPKRRRISQDRVQSNIKEESDVTSSEGYESTDNEEEDVTSTSSDESPDSAGEDQELGATGNDEVVQTNFNFEVPKEQYFHGLRSLLQNYMDGHEFDVSGLVDLILKQVRFCHEMFFVDFKMLSHFPMVRQW